MDQAHSPLPPETGFRPVVLVPTYNNAGTLLGVLHAVAAAGHAILVVDDGSTDSTPSILSQWLAEPHDTSRAVVRHPVNRGKSDGLRTGFAAASEAGFTHALTIDSDGQHEPAEIPALLEAARRSPAALILGVRSDAIEHCPPRSLKARKVANTLTALECGVSLTDTQCGLRVYPLGLVAAVPCRAGRYGYEAEIIPRAAWAGCEIKEVPIACIYFPADRRVSHFQPYRDSLRQLRMHGRLLARALIPWPRHPQWPGEARHGLPGPGKVVREAWKWVSPARAWREMRDDPRARPQMALAVAAGVLIGNLPPGLHTITALYVARRLHLHPLPVFLATHIGVPPFLIVAQFAVGHLLLTGAVPRLDELVRRGRDLGVWSLVEHLTLEYAVGMVVLGSVLTILAYVVTRALLRLVPIRQARTPDGR